MWISRKNYNFLKENAEKNIDIECQILTVKENEKRAVARAMEEYSTVLEERDNLRLRVIELEHELNTVSKKKDLRSFEEVLRRDLQIYFDGAANFMNYINNCPNGRSIDDAFRDFMEQFGEVKEVDYESSKKY